MHNCAHHAVFAVHDLQIPFAQGTFRFVAHGRYVGGCRDGEACVTKWRKQPFTDLFDCDIRVNQRALFIIEEFNRASIITKNVRLNVPEVWTFPWNDLGGSWAGQRALTEPFIHGFRKFNSNTGWKDMSSASGRELQALSHYSYHITSGTLLLCGLQGGVLRNEIVLSDPAILSMSGEFGLTDLGRRGIRSFFSQHSCDRYCRPHWMKPTNPVQFWEPISSSTASHTGGFV